MKGLTFGLFAVVLAAGCNSNWNTPTRIGSGVAASEDRPIGQFDQIVVQGAMDVEATVGMASKLTIEADDNLLEIVTTEIKGTELVVSTRESYQSKLGIKIKVAAPSLRAVKLNGSGNVNAAPLTGPEFEATLAGSGNISATGNVDKLRGKITGSGNLKLDNLQAKDVTVAIIGSGNADVHATDTLDATISGSGNITYQGQPKASQSILGSGTISPAK